MLAWIISSLILSCRQQLHGHYISLETGLERALLDKAFPGPVRERPHRLKAQFDPEQLFDQNFSIPPLPAAVAAQWLRPSASAVPADPGSPLMLESRLYWK